MKFRVIDLINLHDKDNTFESIIDYSYKKGGEILDVEPTEVTGDFNYLKNEDGFLFNLHIKTVVTEPCSITLEPVKVFVDFETNLFYTYKVLDDDSFEIKGNEITLDEEIWGEIIMNLPTRVIKEGAVYVEEDEVTFEKESPFSSLKDEDKEEE